MRRFVGFKRKKIDWPAQVEAVRTTEPYAEYDRIVNEVITKTRRMAHCDQWVLHAPTECEYCDEYPELQLARTRLGINFTGKQAVGHLTCPAEKLRPLEKIERWYGNVPETPERAEAREEYWKEFDRVMRESFPDWDSKVNL